MAGKGSKRHTHKYRKLPSQIWACGLGDCTHYMPLNMIEMMEGRISLCWSCGDKLILGISELKMDKPICSNCILKAQGIGINKAEALLEFINQVEKEKSISKSLGRTNVEPKPISKVVNETETIKDEITDSYNMDGDDDNMGDSELI